MKKKKLLLLELCLLCMATSGFKTKESEPLYVGIADVNKEADLGFKDYLDVYSYADMKRMVNDKKIKKYENEIESITERYSNIYGIKSNLINKIIEISIVGRFLEHSRIYIFGKEEKFDSYNKQILLLIRDVYYNPEKYNLNKNEIIGNEFHQDIKLRDFVYEISDLVGVDPDMALSIACAESGYFEASIATSRNNPYALNSSNGFIYFDNIYEGITEGIINLKENYIDLGLTTYESITSKYCPGSTSWSSLVRGVSNELKNGKVLYDERNLKK